MTRRVPPQHPQKSLTSSCCCCSVCLTSHDDDDDDDVATRVRATRAHVVRRDANDDDADDGAGCAERAGDGAA